MTNIVIADGSNVKNISSDNADVLPLYRITPTDASVTCIADEAWKQLEYLGYTRDADTINISLIPPKTVHKKNSPEEFEALRKVCSDFVYTDKRTGKPRPSVGKYQLRPDGSISRRWNAEKLSYVSHDGMAYLRRMNAIGWSVYVVVNSGVGHEDRDITECRSLFWESDDKSHDEQMAEFESFVGQFDRRGMIVGTRSSLHCYVRRAEPITPAEFKSQQLRAIAHFNSDGSLNNPARLMRLAGFDHTKINHNGEIERVACEIKYLVSGGVSNEAIDAALPQLAAPIGEGKKEEYLNRLALDEAPPELAEVVRALSFVPHYVAGNNTRSWYAAMICGMLATYDEAIIPYLLGWQSSATSDEWSGGFEQSVNEFLATVRKGTSPARATLGTLFWAAREKGGYLPPWIMPTGLDAKEQAAWRRNRMLKLIGKMQREYDNVTIDYSYKAPRMTDDMSWLELIKMGEAYHFRGAQGVGKTELMIRLLAYLESVYGKGNILNVELISHRIKLGQQTAKRFGVTHRNTFKPDGVGNAERAEMLRTMRELAYCINSAHHRDDALTAIPEGKYFVLMIDELMAVLRAASTSSNITPIERNRLVAGLARTLKMIAAGRGILIGAEANLSDVYVNFLRALCPKVRHHIIENTQLPKQYQVMDYSYSESGKIAAVDDLRAAAVQDVTYQLKSGRKGFFAVSSQATAETIDLYLTELGYKVGRFDSITCSGNDGMGVHVNDIDKYLMDSDIDVMIYTPTLEAGVSIDCGWGDFVIGLGFCNEPEALQQMLNRVRHPVERRVYASTIAAANFGKINAKKSLKDWNKQLAHGYAEMGVVAHEEEHMPILREFTTAIESMVAIGSYRYHDRLMDLIGRDGHVITSGVYPHCTKATKEGLVLFREVLVDRRVAEWLAVDDASMSLQEAQTIRNTGEASHTDALRALKRLRREYLTSVGSGGEVDNPEMVRKFWTSLYDATENWRDNKNAPTLRDADLAARVRRKNQQIEKDITGSIISRNGHTEEKAQAIIDFGLSAIITDLLDTPIASDHPAITEAYQRLLTDPKTAKRLFGVTPTEKTRPGQMIFKVITELGMGLEVSSSQVDVKPESPPVESMEHRATINTTNSSAVFQSSRRQRKRLYTISQNKEAALVSAASLADLTKKLVDDKRYEKQYVYPVPLEVDEVLDTLPDPIEPGTDATYSFTWDEVPSNDDEPQSNTPKTAPPIVDDVADDVDRAFPKLEQARASTLDQKIADIGGVEIFRQAIDRMAEIGGDWLLTRNRLVKMFNEKQRDGSTENAVK